MPWSNQSIEQAIQVAKNKNAIFVVYVEDDEKQSPFHSIIENSEISDLLNSDQFIAIRIGSSSQSYRDFVAIYQLVPIPSLFFIGLNGWPLEIITSELPQHAVVQRVKKLIEPSEQSIESSSASEPQENVADNDSPCTTMNSTATSIDEPVPTSSQAATSGSTITLGASATSVLSSTISNPSISVQTSPSSAALLTSFSAASLTTPVFLSDSISTGSSSRSNTCIPCTSASIEKTGIEILEKKKITAETMENSFVINEESESEVNKSTPGSADNSFSASSSITNADRAIYSSPQSTCSSNSMPSLIVSRASSSLATSTPIATPSTSKEDGNSKMSLDESVRSIESNEVNSAPSSLNTNQNTMHGLRHLQHNAPQLHTISERTEDNQSSGRSVNTVQSPNPVSGILVSIGGWMRSVLSGARPTTLRASHDFEQNRTHVGRVAVPNTDPVTCDPPSEPGGPEYAHIQFRLPDGSTHSRIFMAKTTIGEVREYVQRNIRLPFRDFILSTSYPRIEFTEQDANTSVAALGLVPRSVILIIPGSEVSEPHYITAAYGALLTLLLWPFTTVFSLLANVNTWLFGRADENRNEHAVPQQQAREQMQSQAQSSNRNELNIRRRMPSSSTIQRDGNVYRLSNRQDESDDENNTWNGNSTQQM